MLLILCCQGPCNHMLELRLLNEQSSKTRFQPGAWLYSAETSHSRVFETNDYGHGKLGTSCV